MVLASWGSEPAGFRKHFPNERALRRSAPRSSRTCPPRLATSARVLRDGVESRDDEVSPAARSALRVGPRGKGQPCPATDLFMDQRSHHLFIHTLSRDRGPPAAAESSAVAPLSRLRRVPWDGLLRQRPYRSESQSDQQRGRATDALPKLLSSLAITCILQSESYFK